MFDFLEAPSFDLNTELLEAKSPRVNPPSAMYTRATPKFGGFVRGHDKPTHGSCAIYFPGGIFFEKHVWSREWICFQVPSLKLTVQKS